MGVIDWLRRRHAVTHIFQQPLNEEKQDMIRGIVDLSDTSVREVMIPRIDVDFLELSMSGETLVEKVTESGHSRFPVYEQTIDNVVGVLYVKDLIKLFGRPQEVRLERLLRKPFFVPESKRIDSLLRELDRKSVV